MVLVTIVAAVAAVLRDRVCAIQAGVGCSVTNRYAQTIAPGLNSEVVLL